jgi:AbiV family abortive infection protein
MAYLIYEKMYCSRTLIEGEVSLNKKQKYIYPLRHLEDGFFKIPLGIKDLIKASNILLEKKVYAPSLSLSVIALEECGKLFILDSLLFLRDKKNNYYKKSSISHKDKLDALQFCIPLLLNISKHDKKYKNENLKDKFQMAIKIGLKNLHIEYVQLREQLPRSDFRELDILKQRGFYSDSSDNIFKTPSSNIDKKLSIQINELANSFYQNITFIMNNEAVDDYISMAKNIRGKLSQEDWIKIADLLDVKTEETFH